MLHVTCYIMQLTLGTVGPKAGRRPCTMTLCRMPPIIWPDQGRAAMTASHTAAAAAAAAAGSKVVKSLSRSGAPLQLYAQKTWQPSAPPTLQQRRPKQWVKSLPALGHRYNCMRRRPSSHDRIPHCSSSSSSRQQSGQKPVSQWGTATSVCAED
jgi:hypothetical protein